MFAPIRSALLLLLAEHGILGGSSWLGPLLLLILVGPLAFTPWATQDGGVLMMPP